MPVRTLSPALAEKARLELNEESKLLEESICHLKQWVLEQPHLRARTDDQWLAAFVRGCKFRLDQSKTKLDLYFSYRSTAPYLYSVKYFEPKAMDIVNLGVTLFLTKTKNPEDPRILLYRISQWDTKRHTALDLMAVFNLMQQISFMEDDNLIVAGITNVIDMANTRLGHYTQTSFQKLRTLVAANQDAVPVRIKAIHILNTPPIFHTFFNIFKRFMNEKSRNRVMLHGKNMESLHRYVPKEVLPEEYGGTGESIQECIDYWKRKMSDYSSFFDEDLKYGTVESERLSKFQSLPVEKSLNRLEID